MATYDDILNAKKPLGGVHKPPIDVNSYVVGEPGAQGDVSSARDGVDETKPVRTVRRAGTTAPTASTASASAPGQPAAQTSAQGQPAAQTSAPVAGQIASGQTAGQVTGSEPQKGYSYVEMYRQMNPYTPPTKEDVEKEKRKQKRQAVFAAISDGISALSNLYFTSRYSPNAWDANSGMSPKMRERWDRLKKEHDENQRTWMEGYMRAAAMDDANEKADREWKHLLEREDKEDARYDAEIKHRGEREDKEDARYDAEIKHRGEREQKQDEQWQKTFDQAAHQFKVTSSFRQQEINLHARSLAHQMASDSEIITLGTGKGQVIIPKAALNDANIAYIYSKLPDSVRDTVDGPADKEKESGGKEEVRHRPPDSNAMLLAIGANIETCPAVQAAVREVSGEVQTSSEKGRGY